jgi:hypothetical protein
MNVHTIDSSAISLKQATNVRPISPGADAIG